MAITQSASLMTLGLHGDRGMTRHTSVPALGANVEFRFGRPKYMVKGAESELRPVKDKVRAAVKKRRLRLEEFFQPFDVTKTKKVSEVSFVRAMDASGIGLTREELGLVISRYKIPGSGGGINYQKFCDQSNKVFTAKGLERTPGKSLVRSLEHPTPAILGACNPNLTPVEKARTADMLEDMRRTVRDASLVVKNLFNQYDRHANGCITGEQFLRVINCHALLSADKILNMERYGHVLVKAFTERVDGPGLEAVVINYKALHDQLMEEDSWENCVVEPRPALLVDSHPEEYNVPDGGETEGERLEKIFVQEAVARRLEVTDYFRVVTGGDAAGGKFPGSAEVGLCSRERFKQLLKGLWRTHFTDGQVEALACRYPPSGGSFPVKAEGTVNLAAFARHVYRRVLQARKHAAAAGGTGIRPGGGGVISPSRLSVQEAHDVADVILDIRGRIARQRISLKPAFRSFDPRNELVVANEQFKRVLSTEGLLPVDARLRELITRRYVVADFRRQTTVHQGFVAYLEFLRDVDAPIEMETQAYIDNFVFGRDPNIDAPSNTGTTIDKQDASTTPDGVALKSAASLTSEALMGRGGVGCNPARDCGAVLRDVRRRTARERVRILDLFQDFDRIGHGMCTQAQLGRVMKTLDHALTDGELAAVCQRYQSNIPGQCSPGDGTQLIVYTKFVSDIEAVFTVEELEKKPCTTRVAETVREARGTERRLKGESSRVEELTPGEERMLAKFLRELAMKVNKESLSLPTLFMDYDKFNVGDITEAGMERALGGACLLPPEPVFRAIVKKFREHSRRSSGGEVNYRAFLAAVELAQDPLRTPRDLPNATKFRAMREEGAADETTTISGAQSLGSNAGRITPRTQNAVLRSALVSVGFQLSRCHCQLEDFLAHEDTLKLGEVTSAAMRHCLVLAGVRLTTPELMVLDRSFRSMARPEMIAWKDLCKAAVGTAEGATSGKHHRAAPSIGTETNGDIAPSATPTPSTWKEKELLIKIDGEMKARNPNLEALFRVCDRSNRGTVTEAQFFSLLNQGLPRIHLTSADTDTLARLFVDRTGCDFGGQVRYKEFMQAVGS